MKTKPEPTRTRQHGTRVTNATTAADILTAFRAVLTDGFSKINGLTIDTTTASMLVRVTDALNEVNRVKWLAKIDAYLTAGQSPALVTKFWVDSFWKLTR